MPARDLKRRQLSVTDEPFAIAPEIKGRELATLRRRSVAITLDALAWFVLGVPFLLLLTYASIYVQAPSLARDVTILIGAPSEGRSRGLTELLAMVRRRRPGVLPQDIAAPLAAGDLEAAEAIIADYAIDLFIDLTNDEPTYYDAASDQLHIHRDVIFGPLGGAFSMAAFGLIYFGLSAWIGKGRTPGKWLLGIRAVRLDGMPLSLWDSVGRAGALTTVGLGFFDALRDPNRQTTHDRAATTVVIRDPKHWPRLRRLWNRIRSLT